MTSASAVAARPRSAPSDANPKGMTLAGKLSLAVGDYAMNLYWQSMSFFLLYFYTDIVGIDVAVAGTIYMAASLFDGCIDPLFGILIERTQTRWGRYRPWLVAGAVPLALSFLLLYWSPSAQGSMLVAIVTGAHLLFRMCYTSVGVPVASLVASVTRDAGERASLTGYRMLFAAAGSTTVALGTRPLTHLLGTNEAMGFLWVAALTGVVATAIFLFVALRVREWQDGDGDGRGGLDELPPTLGSRLLSIRVNTAFIALVVGLVGAQLAITIVSKSLVYYFKYVVKDPAATSMALTIVTSSAFVLVPVWARLAKHIGKRKVWLTGSGLGLATLACFALVQPDTALAAIGFYLVLQVAIVAMIVSYWSMLPDTVEFGQWRSGYRTEAFLVGLFMFFQKMGLGLAAGMFGWALALGGVHHVESDAAGMASILPVVIVALAGGGIALSGLATFLSPLKAGVHEEICRILGGASSYEKDA